VTTDDPLALIAEQARGGDSAAVRKLLDAVAPAMLGAIRAVLGRGDRDLEDVLQDALVGVVKALPSFRGESSVAHFARSVALRRALDQRRSRARRGAEVDVLDERLPDPGTSPAASVVAARRRQALRLVLGELRPEQAEAFAQQVIFGSSIEEIAHATNAPIETVRSRLRLAKTALRARISNDPALLELSEMNDDDAP
jgi:RNA polymerase sigma-70 factor (ECF subfamily)